MCWSRCVVSGCVAPLGLIVRRAVCVVSACVAKMELGWTALYFVFALLSDVGGCSVIGRGSSRGRV